MLGRLKLGSDHGDSVGSGSAIDGTVSCTHRIYTGGGVFAAESQTPINADQSLLGVPVGFDLDQTVRGFWMR